MKHNYRTPDVGKHCNNCKHSICLNGFQGFYCPKQSDSKEYDHNVNCFGTCDLFEKEIEE
jgi:hypothetical protein